MIEFGFYEIRGSTETVRVTRGNSSIDFDFIHKGWDYQCDILRPFNLHNNDGRIRTFYPQNNESDLGKYPKFIDSPENIMIIMESKTSFLLKNPDGYTQRFVKIPE